MTDHLVADTERQWSFAPATSDSMNVRPTDTASNDLDVNVTVLERFGFELRRVSQSRHSCH